VVKTLWRSPLPATKYCYGGIAIDTQGNIVVAGWYNSPINFGSPCSALPPSFGRDTFLAKLDTNGTCIWSEHFTSGNGDQGLAVITDSSSNIILAGVSGGNGPIPSINFGNGSPTYTNSGNALETYVAKFNSAGAWQAAGLFGDGTNVILPRAIKVDSSGNIFLTGGFQGTVNFGGSNLVNVAPPVQMIFSL